MEDFAQKEDVGDTLVVDSLLYHLGIVGAVFPCNDEVILRHKLHGFQKGVEILFRQ